MKKLIALTAVAAFMAGCSDDGNCNGSDDMHLISPALEMSVSTASGQSPLTGILTVAACNANSSIYYGNYVNNKLTPFDGYYHVKDGALYDGAINRRIMLPQVLTI